MRFFSFLFGVLLFVLPSQALGQEGQKSLADQVMGFMADMVEVAKTKNTDCDAMAKSLNAKMQEHALVLQQVPYATEQLTEDQKVSVLQFAEELGKSAAICYENASVKAFFDRLGQ